MCGRCKREVAEDKATARREVRGVLMEVRTCACAVEEGMIESGVGRRDVAEQGKHVRGGGKGKEQWLLGESVVLGRACM